MCNLLHSLTHQDRKIIASQSGWLTDEVITAAQIQYFPGMSGLQPPTLQEVCAFQVHTGEFVQIVNIRNKHWCVVFSVGCDGGVVNVYDSLYSSVSNKTIHLIARMVYSSSSTLEVRMMDVAKQSNSSDCGILSIAYAFDLCSVYDPCEVKYDPPKNQTTPGHVLGELPVVTISFVVRTKKLQSTFTVHVVCPG